MDPGAEKLCGSPYFSCVPIESVLRLHGSGDFHGGLLLGIGVVIRGVFSRGVRGEE